MSKVKKISKIKIIIAAVLLIAVAFSVYNILWFQYIRVNFDPLLKNERLMQMPRQEHRHEDTGWTVHSYNDCEGSGYAFTVAVPAYLKFGGNISAGTRTDVKLVDNQLVFISECQIHLMIFPHGRRYLLDICDLTGLETVEDDMRTIGMLVDKDGNALGSPNDTESELYQEWLAWYNKFHEPIMDFFSDIKEILGEDTFR